MDFIYCCSRKPSHTTNDLIRNQESKPHPMAHSFPKNYSLNPKNQFKDQLARNEDSMELYNNQRGAHGLETDSETNTSANKLIDPNRGKNTNLFESQIHMNKVQNNRRKHCNNHHSKTKDQ